MKTIKLLLFFVPIFLLLLLSCEEDTLPEPTSFIASQGTYLGVVHLAYETVNEAANYDAYRLNNETAEWQDIAWTECTNWDDEGFLLNNNELIPGQVYQYKVRSHADGPGFSPFSEIATGYSFDPDEVDIISISRNNEDYENLVIWSDPNDYSGIQNINSIEYILYVASEDNINNFTQVGSTTDLSYNHSFGSFNSDKVFYYKIVTRYNYQVNDQHWSSFSRTYDTNYSIMAQEGSGGNDPSIVSYTKTDLGTVVTSGDAISFTELKQNAGNIYLGVLEEVSLTGYGTPAVYMFNGSSWGSAGGTLPSNISGSTSFSKMGIAASASKIYLAAIDGDSIFVHESTGSAWSGNLSVNNLGYAESPSAMDIEVLNDELYMALKVYPDWDLKIYKWTETDWLAVGGDANGFIESGVDIFNVSLENYNGNLYLAYTVANSDYNHTLHIKHWTGSTWESDLEWTADNITQIKIAKSSTDLYFISQTQAFASYKGGVYKVTSGTTVEELISENDDWFYTPYDISIDSEGNLIITSIKYESETLIYPNLSLYNGSSWNTISGDFSGGKTPVSVYTDGTDIYYVYGDANNVTSWNDTKALKSMKLSK